MFIKLDLTTGVPLLTLVSMSKAGEGLTCNQADLGLGALTCANMTFDSVSCNPFNLVKTITLASCAFAFNDQTGTLCSYRYRTLTITA